MKPPLQEIARLALGAGCNLAPGQPLVVEAPTEAQPLADMIAAEALRHGARHVTHITEDMSGLLARLDGSDTEGRSGHATATASPQRASDVARIRIFAPRPDVLEGVDPRRILQLHEELAASSAAAAPGRDFIADTTILFPTPSWASRAFPDLTPGAATDQLWQALSRALLLDTAEPAQAWQSRFARLTTFRNRLNRMQLQKLTLRGRSTELTLSVAPGAMWTGGTVTGRTGRTFAPTLPCGGVTISVAPETTDGRVHISRPIALFGEVVSDLDLVIENGILRTIVSKQGQSGLHQLLKISPQTRKVSALTLSDQNRTGSGTGQTYCNPLLDAAHANGLSFGNGEDPSALQIGMFFDDPDLTAEGTDVHGALHRIITRGTMDPTLT